MKVTVLIENTIDENILNKDDGCNELKCEHGLSLLIEFDGKKILLDAGSSEAFFDNAVNMGADFGEIDIAVLSHGHYDHSGGFEAFFRNNDNVKVLAQKKVVNTYYSASGGMHEIGIPKEVKRFEERFNFIDGVYRISENIILIPHSTGKLEEIGKKAKLYKDCNGEIIPDDFEHEQSLVFDTDKGLVIFNSCSHGGVENIIREAKKICNGKNVYAYIGGLHMKGKKNGEEICTFAEGEIDELCDVIKNEGILFVYTGHCTGKPGYNKLKERLNDVIYPLSTGMSFEIDC